MNGLIDSLIKVSVSISKGVENEESFNNILLIGKAPSDEYAEVGNDVKVYSSTDEVLDAGWTAKEATYKAASIACGVGRIEQKTICLHARCIKRNQRRCTHNVQLHSFVCDVAHREER